MLSQSSLPDEVLIIVDATDEEFDLENINFSEKLIPKIYFNGQRRGANYSRNFGYTASKGNLILFCDDDDIFYNDKVSHLRQILDETDVPTIIYHQYEIYYPNLDLRYIKEIKDPDKTALLVSNIVGPTSFVGVTKIYDILPFDETLEVLQDWDAWMNLVWNHGFCLRAVHTVLGTYHINNIKSTSKNIEKFEKSYRKLNSKRHAIISEKNIVTISDKDLMSSYFSTKAWKLLHTGKKFSASGYFLRSFTLSHFDWSLLAKSVASFFGLRVISSVKKLIG